MIYIYIIYIHTTSPEKMNVQLPTAMTTFLPYISVSRGRHRDTAAALKTSRAAMKPTQALPGIEHMWSIIMDISIMDRQYLEQQLH